MIESWKLTYEGLNSKEEKLRETLCTLGNGYFATRGACELSGSKEGHYPGTYLSGGYNRLESEISGKIIENEDLVNWPNWLSLSFRIENGEWFSLNKKNTSEYKQELDLQRGVLKRKIVFKDEQNRITQLESKRIVSMHDKNLAAIHWKLEAQNWSGNITIRSELDANISNKGVERYKDLKGDHLEMNQKGQVGEDGIYLYVRTNQSHILMAQSARLSVYHSKDRAAIEGERETVEEENHITQEFSFQINQLDPVSVEKIVAIYTSRDLAISEPLLEARNKIQRVDGYHSLLEDHELAWKHLWSRGDLNFKDGEEALGTIRLHIFHIFQTVSLHSIEMDTGVPARGLHGEAYRGHIFWDELFIFPFLNYCIPNITEALLMYRYRRLPEARNAAKQAGYKGAMFPWQSGSNGREESQKLHLNPKSGRWIPDNTHLQHHINSAIAYNIWHYFQVTEDKEYMYLYGAEMYLEIARFWASIASYDKTRDRYEIKNVVGPDEYHTQYPNKKEPGLNNNAYTNFMAAWVLRNTTRVLNILDQKRLDELLEMLGIPQDEIHHWETISKKMYIPFLKNGMISQFDGYDSLKELDWEHYMGKYGEQMRLDRILEEENDSPNKYKASKQADVLMLFYLFSAEELVGMFEHMGYEFDPASIPDNIRYYADRTSHGSTLSRIVYSWVWSRANREKSWYNFEEALMSDLQDIQGGTTPEGIHLGAMAGTIDLIQRCYTGLEARDEILWFNPALPEGVQCLNFKIRYKAHTLTLKIEQEKFQISFDYGWWNQELQIGFRETAYSIKKGQTKTFSLREKEAEV